MLAGVLAVATRRAVSGLIDRTRELEAESKLRQEAESTLRQVQKMEAVGQLTGGIAHDFNNLLTIIIGNLDTMKRRLADLAKSNVAGDAIAKLETPLESAMKGAKARRSSRKGCSPSRGVRRSSPQRLDMNRMVSGMLEMLRRTLGSDISMETVLGAGLWTTFADGHQLENVLLNLTLNAKAAMPDGGCLTIETANTYLDYAYARRFGDVKAGHYVVLCVTDTGTGIPADILDQVFRAVLHHQAAGRGVGARTCHGARLRQAIRRSRAHLQRSGSRNHGEDLLAALRRRRGGQLYADRQRGQRAGHTARPA